MATTTNYGWTTPDDTALVKDGAAAIRSLGTAIDTTTYNNAQAAIAKTLIDAKGDLIVGSAADTAARLAVGTNGYILTANSGATNGVEWAAPAGGGGMTLLSTTTLSGQSTVASSISGSYTDLLIIVEGINATNNNYFLVRPNSSGSTAGQRSSANSSGNRYEDFGTDLSLDSGYSLKSGNTNNVLSVLFRNYASTTAYKIFEINAFFYSNQAGTPKFSTTIEGAFESTSAISSFQVYVEGTATAGTMRIYGIK